MANTELGKVAAAIYGETAPTDTSFLWGKQLDAIGNPQLVQFFYHDGTNWLSLKGSDHFKDPVLGQVATPPVSPSNNDRYLVAASGTTGAFIGHENEIAVWNANTPGWEFTIVAAGNFLYKSDDQAYVLFNGTVWMTQSKTTEEYFDIEGGTGAKMKAAGGGLELRDLADASYIPLTVSELTITGPVGFWFDAGTTTLDDGDNVLIDVHDETTGLRVLDKSGGIGYTVKAHATLAGGIKIGEDAGLSMFFDPNNVFGGGAGFFIDDQRVGGGGLQNKADYSLDYVARSLIDKGYAEATFAPIGVETGWSLTGTATLNYPATGAASFTAVDGITNAIDITGQLTAETFDFLAVNILDTGRTSSGEANFLRFQNDGADVYSLDSLGNNLATSHSFIGDIDSRFYRKGADNVAIATGGIDGFEINNQQYCYIDSGYLGLRNLIINSTGETTISTNSSFNLVTSGSSIRLKAGNGGIYTAGARTFTFRPRIQDDLSINLLDVYQDIAAQTGTTTFNGYFQDIDTIGRTSTGESNHVRLQKDGSDVFKISIDGYQTIGSKVDPDPTGANGMMYYNTTTERFRAYENSAWVDMIGGGGIGGTIASTQIAYGTGADTIGGEAGFTYTSGTNTLNVPILTINALHTFEQDGSDTLLNLRTDHGFRVEDTAGTKSAFTMSAKPAVNKSMTFSQNETGAYVAWMGVSNASTTADAYLEVQSSGSGDAFTQYRSLGQTKSFALGLDGGTGDFKIHYAAATGFGTAASMSVGTQLFKLSTVGDLALTGALDLGIVANHSYLTSGGSNLLDFESTQPLLNFFDGVMSLDDGGVLTLTGNLVLGSGDNIELNATTGTKIGTATTQKLSFWNATPIVQPVHVADPSGGATVDSEARTAINSILSQMASLGLQAAT